MKKKFAAPKFLVLALLALSFAFSGCSDKTGNISETITTAPATTEPVMTESSETTETPSDEGLYNSHALRASDGSITVVDDENITTILKGTPERIVSLSPAISEIIAALGSESALVGRTQYCDYPPSISDITVIGDMYNVNTEAVIDVQPDLVIASAHTNPDVLKSCRDAGIDAVRVFNNDSFEEAYRIIKEIGVIVDKEAEADELISGMQAEVESVTNSVKGLATPTVYYMVSAGEYGDYAATGDTFISQMIEMCGGINSAKDGIQWAYSLEKLIENDPDVIITTTDTGYAALLPEMTGYKDLTAVKEGRVYEIDANIISRVGPRLSQGLKELAELIHK